MNIIDNFLSDDDFELTQHFFLGTDIDWKFNNCIVSSERGIDQYQFIHELCNVQFPFDSNYSNFIQPLLTKLNARFIFRLKANLRPRTNQIVHSNYHIDMDLNQQTAIFYLNTNDGYTRFKDPSIPDVQSVANRLVTFDGSLQHCGTSCTDQNVRVLLNINYIPSGNFNVNF